MSSGRPLRSMPQSSQRMQATSTKEICESAADSAVAIKKRGAVAGNTGGAEGKLEAESAAGSASADGKHESAAGSAGADGKHESAAGSTGADGKNESTTDSTSADGRGDRNKL